VQNTLGGNVEQKKSFVLGTKETKCVFTLSLQQRKVCGTKRAVPRLRKLFSCVASCKTGAMGKFLRGSRRAGSAHQIKTLLQRLSTDAPFFLSRWMVDFPESLIGSVLGCLSVRDVCRPWRTKRPLWRRMDVMTKRLQTQSICVCLECASSKVCWKDDRHRARALVTLSSLEQLDLAWSFHGTNAGLVHLAALTNLQTLNLHGCHQVTNAGLVHVAALENMQRLNLTGCNKVTDAGLVHVTALKACGG